MRYLSLIYADEQAWTDSEREHWYAESTQPPRKGTVEIRPVMEIPGLPAN